MLLIYLVTGVICASACSSPESSTQYGPAQAKGSVGRPPVSSDVPAERSERPKETQTGLAAFISDKLHGRKTASGQPYDAKALVAAHPTYPMGTVLRVRSEENGRIVEVTVIDRSASGADRPIVDVSRAAAERLDFIRNGTAKVSTDVIKWGTERLRQ